MDLRQRWKIGLESKLQQWESRKQESIRDNNVKPISVVENVRNRDNFWLWYRVVLFVEIGNLRKVRFALEDNVIIVIGFNEFGCLWNNQVNISNSLPHIQVWNQGETVTSDDQFGIGG